MNNKLNYIGLIEKQFLATISKEELIVLKEWYNSSGKNKLKYKSYYSLLKYLRITNNKRRFSPYTPLAYSRFLHRIDFPFQPKQKEKTYYIWLRYAAIFILAFGMGSITYSFLNRSGNTPSLAHKIEIPFGSKSLVTLPDGSQVWLNSGSQLTYLENFGSTHREVTLNGEAFFDVKKNESLPFDVISGDVKIEVLGTKFNFRAYEEDENARVTLVEGSLNVAGTSAEKESVLLSPNQQAVINKKQEKVTVKNVNAKMYTMWTEPKTEILEFAGTKTGQDVQPPSIRVPNVTLRNMLFFDEEPLEQIARDSERVFNVRIELRGEEINTERFYGDFRNDETLSEILRIMADNNNLNFTMEGNEIIISKK